MSVRPSARVAAAALAAVLGLSLAACSSDDSGSEAAANGSTGSGNGTDAGNAGSDGGSNAPAVDTPRATITSNVKRGASDVAVSTLVSVSAKGGLLDDVKVTSEAGDVAGAIADDGATWTATDRLEPGTKYTVTARAGEGDTAARSRLSFTTADLSLDQQTYPSVAPLQGETVGVGMPVVVTFDLPVTDKAAFEKQMKVTSTPAQAGSWYWLNDTTAHWRPKSYWQPGTEVSVDVDVNGVEAGNGIYGQENREVDFQVGDAHIYKVNAKSHQMQVYSNGDLLRTIPITTGKPGFTTRSGVKVIMEKFDSKRMNSETVGIPQGSAEAYDINNVQWAMRVTNSGEFIHAAPWSVGSQGYANVSHGCTGLSTDNAAWLYAMSRRGDVVEYTGTDRPMTFDNGYGDWNKSFKDYRAGSALA
ncbi:L,D-transpeptidase [Nocardioides sp. GXZ039]|uniref:L,D-transpeptidase n=1 Tax=Nocardioides sp. GXZ039 TaxID=3136018 RepID=UPI0030F3BA12